MALVSFSGSIFNVNPFPAGIPPTIGFLVAVFDTVTGELLCFDVVVVGITAPVTAASALTVRRVAAEYVKNNLGHVNAAPPRLEQKVRLNGKFSFPTIQKASPKGKLTTTWGRLKVRQ